MKISDMSNKKLKEEYTAVDETINVVKCFGTKDLMWRDALEKEILKRGGEITTINKVWFREE